MIADSQGADRATSAILSDHSGHLDEGVEVGEVAYEAASWHLGGGQVLYLRARRVAEARRTRLLVVIAFVALIVVSLGSALVLNSLGYLL